VRLRYLVEPLVTRGAEQRRQQNDRFETAHLYVVPVETRLADVDGRRLVKRNAVEAAARASAGLFRWYRDRKPFPAFGAAAFEHVAPPGRCHPGEKAMRTFAPAIVGLISSFHRSRPTTRPEARAKTLTCD
jgi:hypothetical protein